MHVLVWFLGQASGDGLFQWPPRCREVLRPTLGRVQVTFDQENQTLPRGFGESRGGTRNKNKTDLILMLGYPSKVLQAHQHAG